MLLGMGTVFVFLTLLVIGTSLMSALVQKMPSDPEPAPAMAAAKPGTNFQEIAAVAAAARAMHDAEKKK